MTTKMVYKCDFCGTEYIYEIDATQCEGSHIKPKRLTENVQFYPMKKARDGYPEGVEVEFENGVKLQYVQGDWYEDD